MRRQSCKATYRTPYRKKQRCLVAASGFYEWQKRPGSRQPMYITAAGDELLAFAGLVEFWKQGDGEWLTTYTVITGEPNELVRLIYNRMPVILDPADYDRWLNDPDPRDLLQPYPGELLRAYPISTRVNAPANNDETLIAPI